MIIDDSVWPAYFRRATPVGLALLCLAAAACGSVVDDGSAAASSMTGAASATNSTTGEGGTTAGTSGSGGAGGVDDCSAPSISVLASQQEWITGIALDATDVYWGNKDLDANRIRTMPKAGGAVSVLASTEQPPRNIAVDETHVYWSEDVGTKTRIYSVAKAGGPLAPKELAVTGTGGCSGLSVDLDRIYWSAGPWIFSLPKGGDADPTQSVKPDPVKDYDRRGVLADHDRVYWLEGNARIMWRPKSGGTPLLVASLISDARRFVVGEYQIYLGDPVGPPQDSGYLIAVPKDGGQATTLVDVMDGVSEIAANSSCVYWTTSQNGNRLRAVPSLGGEPLTLAPVGASGAVIAADESGVYWGERETRRLMRATK